MRKQGWNKWITVALVVGIMLGQSTELSVRAEDMHDTEASPETVKEMSEEAAIIETAEDISQEHGEMNEVINLPQEEVVKDELPQEHIERLEEDQEPAIALGALASGRDNNITWVIDTNGKLTIEGTGDLSGYQYGTDYVWRPYASQVTSAVINVTGMTDASELFMDCCNMESVDLSGLDTSKVTAMYSMFSGCSSLTSIDMSCLDTSNVETMSRMFMNCSGLASVDLSVIDTHNVWNMSNMFAGCTSLESVDLKELNTSSMEDMGGMFAGCSCLKSADLRGLNIRSETEISSMFFDCSSLENIDLSGMVIEYNVNATELFCGCSSLVSVDLSVANTGGLIDMMGMFADCSSLTSVKFGDIRNVVGMAYMFEGCVSLTDMDLSSLDIPNLAQVQNMFSGCSSLVNVNLGDIGRGSLWLMQNMFSGCSNLKNVNLSNIDTSEVSDMRGMFSGCSSLNSLDLSSLDLSHINIVDYSDVEGWITGTAGMFSNSGIEALKTPHTLGQYPIDLPTTFVDPNGRETRQITTEFCNTTLTRKGGDTPVLPTPTPVPTPTATPVPTPTSAPVVDEQNRAQVSSFVSRMYTVALNRDAEAQGLNDWTNRLLAHEKDGAGIAEGFIMSDEFKNRNLGNQEFVDVLYRTFFNRDADEEGRHTWLSELAKGRERGYVLAGFVNSVEFDNLCDSYGIARGTMREDGSPCNPGIRQFVERQYTKVLNRQGEKKGIDDWTDAIISGRQTAEDVAREFFHSEEFLNRNLNDTEYVETLYETFLGRASDPNGKNNWLQELSRGKDRDSVLEGFSKSTEFAEILKSFGL